MRKCVTKKPEVKEECVVGGELVRWVGWRVCVEGWGVGRKKEV